MNLFAFDEDRDDIARHLVDRMPARPDGDVERTRIDDVVGVVPADHIADLDHRARAIGLVSGRVGAVVEHAVLDIDHAGKDELRQHLLAMLGLLHQAEEGAVGVDDLAALDQGQPIVEALVERTRFSQRLLIGPIDDRLWRGRVRHLVAARRVMTRGLQDLLVPDVEPGRDVPDGLGQRQSGELFRQHLLQIDRRPRAQQAMIVVDEIRKPVVDALMVWHMRVGRMNAHRLRHDLRQRPAAAQQFVVDTAAAFLVASEEPLFELAVEMSRFVTAVFARCGLGCHRFFAPRFAVGIKR